MGTELPGALTPERIGGRIVLLRGEKVLLDSDLAALYGVTTKRLNEQVHRNRRRFPPDFMFSLTDQEFGSLRSQNATSNARPGRGGRRYVPYAFTEHGALMAANVLSSRRAIEVSIFVVRAFIRLRETLAAHKELAKKLEELERKTEALAAKHDALAAATRSQLRQVIEALRGLMSSPEPRRRPIGFVTQNAPKS
jgi:phage regulator Rha-like protein